MAATGFIVICASAICSPGSSVEFCYSWDGKVHSALPDAITDGWKIRDSDDFNIGRITSGKLVDLTFMGRTLNEPKSTLRMIGKEIGLEK